MLQLERFQQSTTSVVLLHGSPHPSDGVFANVGVKVLVKTGVFVACPADADDEASRARATAGAIRPTHPVTTGRNRPGPAEAPETATARPSGLVELDPIGASPAFP